MFLVACFVLGFILIRTHQKMSNLIIVPGMHIQILYNDCGDIINCGYPGKINGLG